MIDNTWTTAAASADLLGLGGADVHVGGLVMTGVAAQHEGTGLPTAARTGGAATALLGGGVGVGTPRVAPALDRRPKSLCTVERSFVPTYLPQNDGTTLGIRSPGRPLS
ncbi:hypothetical protein ACI79P_08305 [Blastococcus sp. SYSU DS0510]